MYKKILALIALLVGVLLVLSFLPKDTAMPVTEADVKSFLLTDLSKQGIGADRVRFTDFGTQDGKWTAEVLIAQNQHSTCPKLEKREYSDVLSFKYRSDENLLIDCNEKNALVFREEALINSREIVEEKLGQGAQGCAFYLPSVDWASEREYCSFLNEAGIAGFAAGAQNAVWVAQWTKDGKTLFIAFDSKGRAVKQK